MQSENNNTNSERSLFNKTPRPLTARGGIRAQTKSRKVGKNWWTKRWMSVLENNYMGAELPRGRAYAQAGQVLNIDIVHGEVKADVQGSEKKPFKVSIKFKPAPKTKWKKLAEDISNKAIYAAKLLTGEMPESIEELFQEHGLSLFPDDMGDFTTKCSCSSKAGSTPCRCVIAVYYLLAEEFDRDPFLFLKLRGLDRESLIAAIGSTAKASKTKRKVDLNDLIGDFEGSDLAKFMDISTDVQEFWKGSANGVSDEILGDVRVPPAAGALAKHLGHFPMWRGEERFLDALDFVYKKASSSGLKVFMGDW